ncbi:MAG: dimethylmenaquinone methyltransferase [Pseudorhodobacter sp. PARRP1]|nr:MAG: dimethylmenaquinone methyltransferase [Pseudorhodobacter sp. PARRP1]
MISETDHKAQLQHRLQALTQRLNGISTALDAPHAQDWEDNATEREGDEVLEGIGHAGVAEIRRIEAALARIAAGAYGVCVRCGAAIPAARLDVLPDTPFCPTCAAEETK